MLVQLGGAEHTMSQNKATDVHEVTQPSHCVGQEKQKKPEQGLKEVDLPERSSATWY